MNILVTGGAGYIGSHTIIQLLESNHSITVVDNLLNSHEESLKRVQAITGKSINTHLFDLRNTEQLKSLFSKNKFDAVIHFAGLKAVGESVTRALYYYQNNLESTLSLLSVMEEFDVKKLVFSSSATVYGDPQSCPIPESAELSATNPYGQTKLMIEQILKDISLTNTGWHITSLRYFNPIGAHESGLIGEDPAGIPNNLLPFVAQVAAGKREKVNVFGGDYDTPDGTGVRDYIHVMDLADAHVAAIEATTVANRYNVYNIGTGSATSVLEIIKAFEKSSKVEIPYEITSRRPGDIAACYADPSLANNDLKWSAKYSIQDACDTAWKWQSQNPNGYQDA